MELFIWNVVPVINVVSAAYASGFVFEFTITSGGFDISKITQFFNHEKSSSIS